MKYTLQDIIDAVQYGFDYRDKIQNDGKKVPLGNTLQWLMWKKDLMEIPEEFKNAQIKEREAMKNQEQKRNIDQPVVKCSYFDLLINWLENCRGKKAMIYFFCWIMLPFTFCFISMIVAIFSTGIAMLFLILAMGVLIFMTIGLFMMLILQN